MNNNVGNVDRAVRMLLGIALIALAATHTVSGNLAIAAYAVGVIAMVTGLIRYCPAWAIFGISTCPLKPNQGK